MGERQRGKRVAFGQRIAARVGDRERPFERGAGRDHVALVGEQRTEVQQRRTDLGGYPRLLQSIERQL